MACKLHNNKPQIVKELKLSTQYFIQSLTYASGRKKEKMLD